MKNNKKLSPEKLQNLKVINKTTDEATKQLGLLQDSNDLFSDADKLNETINTLAIMRNYAGEDEESVKKDLLIKFGNSGNGFTPDVLDSPTKRLATLKANLDANSESARQGLYDTFAKMQEYANSEQGKSEANEMMSKFSRYANNAIKNGSQYQGKQSDNTGMFSLAL